MIGKVKLLSNFKELEAFNKDVEEHGEEVFILGKYTEAPKEKYVFSEMLFDLESVVLAWIVIDEGDKLINIKMADGDVWTIYYDDIMWNTLKDYFK